ncbi:MAG: hypothetical protein M3R08_12080 [Bacteroidota bacterium]|nr:hypothetical protein [Bacteroidota bacterium]
MPGTKAINGPVLAAFAKACNAADRICATLLLRPMNVRYRALIIVASVIVLLFLIGGWFGFRSSSVKPRTMVNEFDPTAIISIQFTDHADPRNNIQLSRGANNEWNRNTDRSIEESADEQAAALLEEFHSLPVKRDMGMIGLIGERYELLPASSCQITFVEVDGSTHTINMGRTTFAPEKAGAWTYVNIPGDKVVYAVEGMLTARLRPGSDQL